MIHVSFTLFIDYLMAAGPERVSMIQDHVDPRNGEFDCYAPFKAAMANVLRTGMQRGILHFWAAEHGGKARANLMALADGFMAGQADIVGWSEPTILPIPIGSDCSVDVNPEIGGMIGGVPTWIKLYLRKEPLSCDRMILMLAVLQRGLDIARGRGLPIEARQVAVFDVREGAICTPTLNEALAARVASYTKLVTAEGVGYGVLRSLAEKELVARDEREREGRAAKSRDDALAVRADAGSGDDDES